MESFLYEHKMRYADKPFFLYMAYQQAHLPNEVDQIFLRKLSVRCATYKLCRGIDKVRKGHLGR